MDLFDCVELQNAGASSHSALTPAPTPSPSLNDLFASLLTMQAEIKAAIAKHAAFERSLLGSVIHHKDDVSLSTYAEAVVDQIFAKASVEFGANNVRLKIDEDQELTLLNLKNWTRDSYYETRSSSANNQQEVTIPVDLQRIRDHLVKRYGNGNSIRIAHEQNAACIHRFFNLDGEPLRSSSYGVVLSKSNYLDKNTWDKKTTYRITSSAGSDWHGIALALRSFAEYSDATQFACEIVGLITRNVKYYEVVTLGSTFLTTTARLKIFKEKIELTIAPEIAHKLQLYLGEFLP